VSELFVIRAMGTPCGNSNFAGALRHILVAMTCYPF